MTSILVGFFAERKEPSKAIKGVTMDLRRPSEQKTLIAVLITLFRAFSFILNLLTKVDEFKERKGHLEGLLAPVKP